MGVAPLLARAAPHIRAQYYYRREVQEVLITSVAVTRAR